VTKRLWINLAVFMALFAVLLYWDVSSVLRPDWLEHPYKVTAQFATSPGLRPGFGVTYLGVPVGTLGPVKLEHGRVDVQLKLNKNVSLPADVRAKVRRKSVVGEPYVDLSPKSGTDDGGRRLKKGDIIPLADTATPLQYSELFDSVGQLLNAVPTSDVNRFLDAIAAGTAGRADDFRALLASSDQLTGTLAANGTTLDQLADDLTTFVHTLATHRDSIGQSFDNIAALSKTLADSREQLGQLVDTAPSLLTEVQNLLNTSGPGLGCTVDSLGSLLKTLDKPSIINSFGQLIALAGPAAHVMRSTGYTGPDGKYLNGTALFTVGDTHPRVYNPPLQLPAVPALPGCANGEPEGATGLPAGSAAPASGAGAVGQNPVTTPGRSATTKPGVGESSRKVTKGTSWKTYLWPTVIGLAVLAALVLLTMLRPWDRLVALRRRNSSDAD